MKKLKLVTIVSSLPLSCYLLEKNISDTRLTLNGQTLLSVRQNNTKKDEIFLQRVNIDYNNYLDDETTLFFLPKASQKHLRQSTFSNPKTEQASEAYYFSHAFFNLEQPAMTDRLLSNRPPLSITKNKLKITRCNIALAM